MPAPPGRNGTAGFEKCMTIKKTWHSHKHTGSWQSALCSCQPLSPWHNRVLTACRPSNSEQKGFLDRNSLQAFKFGCEKSTPQVPRSIGGNRLWPLVIPARQTRRLPVRGIKTTVTQEISAIRPCLSVSTEGSKTA